MESYHFASVNLHRDLQQKGRGADRAQHPEQLFVYLPLSTLTEPVLHLGSQPVMRQQRFEESDTQNPAKLPGEDMLNQRADRDQKCFSVRLDLPCSVREPPTVNFSSEDG